MVRGWDCLHGVYPRRVHDHVVNGWVVDDHEIDDLVTSFAMIGSWIDPRVIDVTQKKPVNGFGVGTTSPSSSFLECRGR